METIQLEFFKDDLTTIEVKLRFLTPELRIKLLKYDYELQKKGKKLNDMPELKSTVDKGKEINDKIETEIAKWKEGREITAEQEQEKRNELSLKFVDEFDNEDLDKTFSLNKIVQNFTMYSLIDFIKLIAIPISDKELFYGKEIWNYANIEQLEEIRNSFRRRYKI